MKKRLFAILVVLLLFACAASTVFAQGEMQAFASTDETGGRMKLHAETTAYVRPTICTDVQYDWYARLYRMDGKGGWASDAVGPLIMNAYTRLTVYEDQRSAGGVYKIVLWCDTPDQRIGCEWDAG